MVASPSDIKHEFNLKVFGALVIIWILIYVCIFKGIKLVSHVVKFTAIFPVVLVVILAAIGKSYLVLDPVVVLDGVH